MSSKNVSAIKTKGQVTNSDGWFNVVTGMGTSKDKTTYAQVTWQPLQRDYCEKLYAGDEIARKICSIVAYDGTREGISFNMDENADQKAVTQYLDQEFDRLKIFPTFAWAWTVARIYGGACIFLSVDGGSKDLETPLRANQIRRINALRVFDRFSLVVNSDDLESDLSSPRFGEPNFYNFISSRTGVNGAGTIRIHHSRLIRIDGVRLPDYLFRQNNYWHDSIFGSLSQAIRNYSLTHNAIAQIISDFNQPVYRIEGLSEAIAMDQEELVSKKLTIVNLMRSTARAIVLDKEDAFENVSTNVAGGKELIDLTVQRLVAGSDIPHTRLLGNSPTGLGATGKSELINYYDSVKSMQNSKIRGPLEILIEMIFSQSEAIPKPNDLTFKFNPLFQQDLEIEIKTRKMQAEADQLYMESGVLDPMEVAESRFSSGNYSFETVIDPSIDRSRPVAQGESEQDAPITTEDLSDL